MEKTLSLILLSVFVVSCMSEQLTEQDSSEVAKSTKSIRLRSKKDVSFSDTLFVKNKMQSDFNLIMLNHIVFDENGNCSICLSPDEAQTIGIPQNTYDEYSSFVESFNDRSL